MKLLSVISVRISCFVATAHERISSLEVKLENQIANSLHSETEQAEFLSELFAEFHITSLECISKKSEAWLQSQHDRKFYQGVFRKS